jgi:hypothetical protein
MLVDAFMFSDELDILELRLECLDEHVDRFVLVESEVNHVGGPKELLFQNNKDFPGKIRRKTDNHTERFARHWSQMW